ncbi:hypothetical protein GPJ56_000715 [Histomonas meleagridis]|uniref:uncharacterized protein n=1 Tax=Histomonas meleagridis TaxID=135588 RepID=UPI003559E694|nr:hypothetical protein GPJ56_000715 [Histomonas meleagridis]KAH0804526.1 hypothetical protein GO595_003356 [Histomonas meleagridis]
MKSIAFLSTDDPTIIADSAKIIMMLHTQIKQISDETTQEIVEEAEALRNNEAQDVAEAMDELIAVLCTDEETDF